MIFGRRERRKNDDLRRRLDALGNYYDRQLDALISGFAMRDKLTNEEIQWENLGRMFRGLPLIPLHGGICDESTVRNR